jgi:hypothetical protein
MGRGRMLRGMARLRMVSRVEGLVFVLFWVGRGMDGIVVLEWC